MSFGDGATPEEEPVFSEAELAEEENDEVQEAALVEEADPVQTLVRERDEYLLALQRTQADFENYRKRIARQQEEQAARASQHLVDKLLPVLDALDLAENHLREAMDTGEGAKALHASRSMLMDILLREGLERLDQPEVPFDPVGARRRRARGRGGRSRRRDHGGGSDALRLPLEGAGAAPRHGPRAGVN